MKPTLTFYTNIVSPYQLNFFDELATRFSLKVVFYSQSESDREWDLTTKNLAYEVVTLSNGLIAKSVQKFIPSFHFSSKILSVVISDKSEFVILGGNYFIPNTLIALFVCSVKRKNVYWFGERLLPSGPIKTIIKKIMLQPVMRWTNAIFAVGEEGINSYIRYGYTKPCFNIPYNIDDRKFDEEFMDSTRLAALREKHNPSKKVIVLTSGSLIARKGMDTAIKAFKAVNEENRGNAELWILGDGLQRAELEGLADDMESIRFLGFLQPEEIPFIFVLSDIFLFCSRYDGWAVVINEALSAGLPVVTTNAASACELIVPGETGYIHDAEAIYDYSASLDLLLSNASLRSDMSRKGKLTAKSWNSASMADKVLKIVVNNGDKANVK
ncbi:glycosyltransferase family 4 protein [Gammaproteobacteria bacterium]|nr:glycosyltransferase family 4 protein [Gammaproteobacteria bacterium]